MFSFVCIDCLLLLVLCELYFYLDYSVQHSSTFDWLVYCFLIFLLMVAPLITNPPFSPLLEKIVTLMGTTCDTDPMMVLMEFAFHG